MKILFIIKDLSLSEPMAILYLSSMLKTHGHETNLALADRENIIKKIADYSPDILAYSVHTGIHQFFIDINKEILRSGMKKNILSLFGGPHPTFFPEIIEEDGIDGVCIGEGEEALLDLVNTFENKGDIIAVPNWWIKLNNQIYKNDVRPLIENLDYLPLPDRELVYSKDRFLKNAKVKHFFSSRGCPYHCTFCFRASFNEIYKNKGSIVRRRSVQKLIYEIKEVKENYPLQFVHFWDDIFVLSVNWLEEFTSVYKKTIGLPFHCHVRADLITPNICKLLKRAGCYSVQMGIETADDDIRYNKLFKKITKEQIINAANLLNQYKIKIFSTNIIGLPGGSLDKDFETLKLNTKCKISYPWVSLYQPYPKTPLAQRAIKEGYFDGNYNKINYSYHLNSVLTFPNIEKKQMENLHMFFAIGANYSILLPLIKLLIKLPKNRIFLFLYIVYYSYTVKTKIFPHSITFLEHIQSFFRHTKKEFGNRLPTY